MPHLILLVFFLLMTTPTISRASVEVTERALLTIAKKSRPPRLQEIEASFVQAEQEKKEFDDQFSWSSFAGGQIEETNRRAILRFIPVFSPIRQAQVGARKAFRSGLSLEASIQGDQRTAPGLVQDATTLSLNLMLGVDLWKNLLGKVTKAQTAVLELSRKRSKLQQSVEQSVFFISLRRLFWSLVATSESMKISEELLTQSKLQAKEMRQRRASSIADEGDVARFEGQVAGREGNLELLKYQKEIYIKQMKSLVPSLQTSGTLKYGAINDKVDEVVQCIQMISSFEQPPMEHTMYDEIVALLEQIKSQQTTIAGSYDDPDLKLTAGVNSVGVDSFGAQRAGDWGGAYDDQIDQNRLGYQVGLELTIPLGNEEETKKAKQKLAQLQTGSASEGLLAEMKAGHEQIKKSIFILQRVIRAQKTNAKKLKIRLRSMKKKYRQARVSTTELVQEQDSYLNSELSIIETQLRILNTLFDYLVIFPQTPCSFNQVIS